MSASAIVKDILAVSGIAKAAWAVAGAFAHKVIQWVVAEYKKAKAVEQKVVKDVKQVEKDI